MQISEVSTTLNQQGVKWVTLATPVELVAGTYVTLTAWCIATTTPPDVIRGTSQDKAVSVRIPGTLPVRYWTGPSGAITTGSPSTLPVVRTPASAMWAGLAYKGV